MTSPPIVLSIAGYDPSSGAGVTADIKTAAAFGCYGVTCITSLTVQSTEGVFAVEPVAAATVREILLRLRQDFDIAAVRIGMLGSGAVAEELVGFLERERLPNVVLDPIVRSSSGSPLIDASGLDVLRRRLLPLADIITPNTDEAAILTGLDPVPPGATWCEAENRIRECALRLKEGGVRAVLVTGGHLAEPVDFLSLGDSYELPSPGQAKTPSEREAGHVFRGECIQSRATHGTGCAVAMAIACGLAHGDHPVDAVREAKAFVQQAMKKAYPLGKGKGPVHHLCGFDGQLRGRDEPRTADKARNE